MPRFANNLSLLFTGHLFEERFAAAARAGFTAVGYRFALCPRPPPAGRAARGLALVLHNRHLPGAATEAGLDWIRPWLRQPEPQPVSDRPTGEAHE